MNNNFKENLNLLLSSNKKGRKHYFVSGDIDQSNITVQDGAKDFVVHKSICEQIDKKCIIGSTFNDSAKNSKAIDDFIRANKKKAFVDLLYEHLEEKGMSNAECYNKVHIDGRSFNKIINVPNYLPQKGTIFALAISLELTMEETEEFLNAAGRSIDYSNDRDLIVCYYIQNGYYDIGSIDDELSSRHLKQLIKYNGNKTKSQD